MSIPVRGIRGATTLDHDSVEQLDERVPELVTELFAVNGITAADVVSMYFTVTPDIVADFPASAARRHVDGMADVPLMGGLEQDVAGALERCVRVLVHAECDRPRSDVRHVFLHGAARLRPDLVDG